MLTSYHTILPAIHTFIHERNEPSCLYSPAAQHHRTLAGTPVLISRPAECRRLSWPRWLGEILRWFARPKTVTHPRPPLRPGIELATVELRVQCCNHYQATLRHLTTKVLLQDRWRRRLRRTRQVGRTAVETDVVVVAVVHVSLGCKGQRSRSQSLTWVCSSNERPSALFI